MKKVLVFLVIMIASVSSSFAACTAKYEGEKTEAGEYRGALSPWYTGEFPKLDKKRKGDVYADSMVYFEGTSCKPYVTIAFSDDSILEIEGVSIRGMKEEWHASDMPLSLVKDKDPKKEDVGIVVFDKTKSKCTLFDVGEEFSVGCVDFLKKKL